MKVSVF